MANIREIQSRINSVKDTMKITNAMYMISSSKMTQARKKLADTEPYFYGLQGEISRILRHVPEIRHPYFDARENIPAEQHIITILSSWKKRFLHSRGFTSSLLWVSWDGIILQSTM